MASLFYPQLSTGALAQYPIQKTRIYRTVTNLLADGTLIQTPDPQAGRLTWKLSYAGLSGTDINSLQALFQACSGPFTGFTFIDPTDNMLAASGDLTASVWQKANLLTLTPGAPDPMGGNGATVITNTSQAQQQLVQSLNVPATYVYCFSLYVASAQSGTLGLIRQGVASQVIDTVPSGPSWNRVVTSGTLNDDGATLTVGLNLLPGQQITVFGPQLEGQWSPSSFRVTGQSGGVYPNTHWVENEFPIACTAPNVYSTVFSIETSV